MNKLLIGLALSMSLVACDVDTTSTTTTTSTVAADSTTAKEAAPAAAAEAPTVLDDSKVYPFMELKEIYAQHWKGEEAGNADLDGKTVTITGKLFGTGSVSELVGGKTVMKSVKMEFRGGKFTDPNFGHDVECHFPGAMQKEILSIKEGSEVTVKGTIEKQEIYIEPDMQYNVLSLIDCALVPKK